MAGKLTNGQIRKVRKAWEIDNRKGFSWICKEMNLPVSRQYLERMAKEQGWKKASPVAPFPCNHVATDETDQNATDNATKNATKAPRESGKQAHHGPLQDREDWFVREYTATFNVAQTARTMGITEKAARELFKRESVQKKIADVIRPRAEKLGIDGDALMGMWAKILTFDTNEIIQHRRQCCPFCYSTDGKPQRAMDEYYDEKQKYDKRRLYKPDLPEFPPYEGEWWNRSLPPNKDCPNCHGEGEPYVWIADTRYLSPFAKYMYCGVKMVKGDMEVVMLNKERAAENLAKALGLFREADKEAAAGTVDKGELLSLYEKRMQESRERERRMCEERGLDVVDVEVGDGG